MKMVSAIYFCCPPELRDDWLITRNDKDGDLEDGKTEEINLRILVRLYHGRWYLPKLLPEDDSKGNDYVNDNTPFSASLTLDKEYDLDSISVLDGTHVDDTFKKNYEAWLEKEVYSRGNEWKYNGNGVHQNSGINDDDDSTSDDDDDDDDDDDEKIRQSTDWSLGTPIPGTPKRRLSNNCHLGISPTLLAQEINKLYHEELDREFNMAVETQNATISATAGGWDTPIEPTNVTGERLHSKNIEAFGFGDDEGDDSNEDNTDQSWLADPLRDVDWTNLSEDELAKRLAIVEEKTVQRWMDVDIDDSRYIKVLNTFENIEDDPMNEIWGAVDPSLETWS
ncbi:unnamed protein product [Absidia cylindrospora]